MSGLTQQQVENLKAVTKAFNVASVKLFGSRAKGEATESSDLDLLVTFHDTPSLIDLVNLKAKLEQVLGLSVDVVQEDSLSPYMKDSILASAQRL